MRIRLIAPLLLLSLSCIHNQTEAVSRSCPSGNICDASLVSVHDGDTFFVNILGIPDVFGRRLGVRLAGIDTPEISASRPCERIDALKAKEFLKLILAGSGSFTLAGVKRDKFFRLVGDVTFNDGASASSRLVEKGLAVPYSGGKKGPWKCL